MSSKDIKSDALYEFIAKSIDDRYILFTFLDIASLSDINFNDLYKGYLERKNTEKNFYYQYLPNNLMYVKQLKDVLVKQYQTQNDKLTNEIKNLNSHIKILEEQNNRLNSKIESIPPHLLMQTKKIQDLINKKEKMFKDDDNKEIDDVDFDTVKFILTNFTRSSSNATPLHLGSEARNIDVVKYYLSEGTIDINAKCTTDKEENTALTKAIINDKIDIAKLLLKNDKIDPNIKSNSYDSKNQYNNNGSYYTV